MITLIMFSKSIDPIYSVVFGFTVQCYHQDRAIQIMTPIIDPQLVVLSQTMRQMHVNH